MLVLRSLTTLLLLFGMLFAIGAVALYYAEAPVWLAVLFAVFIAGLQYAISPLILQWVMKIRWVPLSQIDPVQDRHLGDLCRQYNIPMPRFGIIEDGNPNAFTFGHYPGNARVVVTRGLLDICDEREVRAVIAHELGHIAHWDFVVMTVAATVPMVLYMIWRFGMYSGRGRDRNAGGAALVAIGALIAYIISQYMVLGLSRLREYYADQFSARATGDANALSSALVKIGYGLARMAKEEAQDTDSAAHPASTAVAGARMLGIFDGKLSASMALASASGYSAATGQYSADAVSSAMRWDLWNPWALICELSSSHPLPAKRIAALSRQATAQGHRPLYAAPQRAPANLWGQFFVDIAYNYAPLLGAIAGAILAMALGAGATGWAVWAGGVLLGSGLGMLLRLHFSHPTRRFSSRQVSNLVPEIGVSRVRCIPALLQGQIIGRGIPGLYWSEDLVIQDSSGLMTMDYRQPLRFLEVLFGLFRAERFIGQQVTVEGWYRRFPIPYLEIYRVLLPNGEVHTSHNRGISMLWSTLVTVIGGLLLLVGMLAFLPTTGL